MRREVPTRLELPYPYSTGPSNRFSSFASAASCTHPTSAKPLRHDKPPFRPLSLRSLSDRTLANQDGNFFAPPSKPCSTKLHAEWQKEGSSPGGSHSSVANRGSTNPGLLCAANSYKGREIPAFDCGDGQPIQSDKGRRQGIDNLIGTPAAGINQCPFARAGGVARTGPPRSDADLTSIPRLANGSGTPPDRSCLPSLPSDTFPQPAAHPAGSHRFLNSSAFMKTALPHLATAADTTHGTGRSFLA